MTTTTTTGSSVEDTLQRIRRLEAELDAAYQQTTEWEPLPLPARYRTHDGTTITLEDEWDAATATECKRIDGHTYIHRPSVQWVYTLSEEGVAG